MFPQVIIFYCFVEASWPWATAQFAPPLKSGPAFKKEKNINAKQSIISCLLCRLAPIPPGRRGALSDTAIRSSVCLSVCPSLKYSTLAAWRSCLGYWHADCLQLAGH